MPLSPRHDTPRFSALTRGINNKRSRSRLRRDTVPVAHSYTSSMSFISSKSSVGCSSQGS